MDFYRQVLGLSSKTVEAIRQSFVKEINHLPEYFSLRKFVENIDVPGLIIHDELDDEAPFHNVQKVHWIWKNSKLISTTGLGHNLRSASVVKHIVDFVTESKRVLVEE